MELLDRSRRFWTALTASQKILVGLSGALLLVALVWGAGAAAGESTDRVLGPEADEATRERVLAKLRERNQPYVIRGRAIHVPKSDAQRVMVELAGEGAVSQQAVWAWLEKQNVFATQWDRQTRFRIALQQQLEMMIRKVDAVRNASVVVSPAEDGNQLFRNGPRAKASVVVELHPGRDLTTKNAMAIAGLVASAVPGLERDKVHITDSAGRPFRVGIPDLPSEAAGTHRDYERSIERDIEERLSRSLPSMSFNVSIRAKMGESESKELRHGLPTVIKEEERRRSDLPAPSPAAPSIKGDGGAVAPIPPAPRPQDTELRTEYVVGRTETVRRDPSGQIEKITVGVLYPVQVDREGRETSAPGIPLEDVRAFVVKAAGPPCAAEDVSVIRVPTRAPEPLPEPALLEGALAWLSAHWTKVALGLLALLGIAALVRAVRSAGGGDVEEIRSLTAGLSEAVEAARRPAEGEPVAARLGLKDLVRENPGGVAASLKTWMESR